MNTIIEKQLVITRTFDAPRELVFQAFTDREHLRHWWGHKDCKIEVHNIGAKPGGKFHYSMQFGDSPKNYGVFAYGEINPYDRIVLISSFADEDANIIPPPFEDEWPKEIKNTFTFVESGGKTMMTLTAEPYNSSEAEIRTFEDNFPSMQEGYGGSFDKLEEHLKSLNHKKIQDMSNTSDRELVMTRTLNAPRELVWEAWTKPEHLINWWGPRGFTNTFHEHSAKPGGVWRFIMHGTDGTDYPNRVIFDEVVKPERLTYMHDGDTDAENDPHRFHVVVTFKENSENRNKTDLTMRMILASAEALAAVKKFGAVEGGRQTLDKLEEHLAAMINKQ